ncbi:MAG TPA: hypothetical protein VF826_11455 [Chloroflexia bacterium]
MPHSRDTDSETSRPPKVGKVIDLQGYLAAERALDRFLATASSHPQYQARLNEVAGYGPSLLAVVTRRLDAFRPDDIEELGRAATAFPDRDMAVTHLRKAADDKRNSDARRLGAMLVLEYCLGEPPDEDFVGTLNDPLGSLAYSLRGALQGAFKSPILRSYVHTLLAQSSDLLFGIFSRLTALERDTPAEVARLFALHPDLELSMAVVEALTAQGSRSSVHTLALLEPSLAPEVSHAANRSLQKLRLSGYSPRVLRAPVDGCRALISPIDGSGNRLLMLIAPAGEGSNVSAVLELFVNEAVGVVEASGAPEAKPSDLPVVARPGFVHRQSLRTWMGMPLGEEGQTGARDSSNTPIHVPLLEADFLYGLEILREAVHNNWAASAPLPLDYCLLGHLCWSYAGGLSEADFRSAWEAEGEGHLVAREADLLTNPVFDSWYLASESARHVAQDISTLSGGPPRELNDDSWRFLLPALIRLAHDEYGPEARQRYSERLRRMSEWLHMSGEAHDAECARSAAQTILKAPPETNLLVLRLVQRGILVALNRLAADTRHHDKPH